MIRQSHVQPGPEPEVKQSPVGKLKGLITEYLQRKPKNQPKEENTEELENKAGDELEDESEENPKDEIAALKRQLRNAKRIQKIKNPSVKAEKTTKPKNAKDAGAKRQKTVTAKKNKKDITVSEYLPIEKIENGIIFTKDSRYVKIIEVTPLNFLLRSAREQRNIIYSFISFLKISPDGNMIKAAENTPLDPGTIKAFWVLLDFIDQVEYYFTGIYPVNLSFFLGDEFYEIVFIPPEQEAPACHALSMKPEGTGKRIIIANDAAQIDKLNVPGAGGYCTVSDNGNIQYYKKE